LDLKITAPESFLTRIENQISRIWLIQEACFWREVKSDAVAGNRAKNASRVSID